MGCFARARPQPCSAARNTRAGRRLADGSGHGGCGRCGCCDGNGGGGGGDGAAAAAAAYYFICEPTAAADRAAGGTSSSRSSLNQATSGVGGYTGGSGASVL